MNLKFTIIVVVVALLLLSLYYVFNPLQDGAAAPNETTSMQNPTVTPIEHASAALQWGETTILTDPVGDATLYASYTPNIILLTDIHGDHLSAETLAKVVTASTLIIAPQAVADELPEDLLIKTTVINNGETVQLDGLSIVAVPMYNSPESEDVFHTKGRGNGYVIEKDGVRVYVAGDTSGTPEMRALTNIDIALVPMNLPYTMGIEEAASAVLDFQPKQVYPYHYRGQGGLSDVAKFKEIVDAGSTDVEVVLLSWYPNN